MSPELPPKEYTVTLRPLPGVADPIRALKAALKALLRCYGLKCTRITPKRSTKS